mmetsp:Transcript_50695/g.147124  ORF Transcript_50695/g.147124 Transcript_50695/m.147124 type:complete len:228 (+) Transcript_50695:288-971(+)
MAQFSREDHPPVDAWHGEVAFLRDLGPLRAVDVRGLVQHHSRATHVSKIQHGAVGRPVEVAVSNRHIVVEVRTKTGRLVLAPPLDAGKVLPRVAQQLQQNTPRELSGSLGLGVSCQPEGPAMLRIPVEVDSEVVHALQHRGEQVRAEGVIPGLDAPLALEDGPGWHQESLLQARGLTSGPLAQHLGRSLLPAAPRQQRATQVPAEHLRLLRCVLANVAFRVELLCPG